jgi:hypothetical protein
MRMRRIPLVVVVLLLAALAPAAHATAAAPASFAVAVPARSAAGVHWRTPALDPGREFELVGAAWRGAGGRVQLRARSARGRWTRWARVVSGEPVWSGRAAAVQLRGAGPAPGLRVRAVAVGRTPPEATTAARPAAAGDAGRPPIVPRSAWDPHGRCRPRAPARYGRVDFAIVHHTESLSSYSPAQSAAIVLGICLFHRDGNRWNDIGYDVLVDRVWSSRAPTARGGRSPPCGPAPTGSGARRRRCSSTGRCARSRRCRTAASWPRRSWRRRCAPGSRCTSRDASCARAASWS